MKKSLQTMLGVTLLEIMLVLAIAAMVIVMSIRYYQSASNNQKVATGLNTITGIVAAGESFLATAPSEGLSGLSNAVLAPYLGGKVPASPWGGPIVITGNSATSYSIEMAVSTDPVVCTQLTAALYQNSKLASSTCTGGKLTINVIE